MFFKKRALGLSLILSPLLLASPASAGDFKASFVKHTRHGSFGVQFGGGDRYRGYKRSYRPHVKRVWVPEHYVYELRDVWVEGGYRREYVEPVFSTRYDECSVPYQVQVQAGYWTDVAQPGHYERRKVKVWRPGYWKVIRRRY